jgi:hypothetical protein
LPTNSDVTLGTGLPPFRIIAGTVEWRRMKRVASWVAALFWMTSLMACLAAEPCQTIRGRAVLYSGDSYLEIWHVGTHHTFFVVDDKSTDLILETMHYNVNGPLQGLFADFTICPTSPFRQGHAQAAIVKHIENARVATLKK